MCQEKPEHGFRGVQDFRLVRIAQKLHVAIKPVPNTECLLASIPSGITDHEHGRLTNERMPPAGPRQ